MMFITCALLTRRNVLICIDVHKGYGQKMSFMRRQFVR